MLYQRKLRNETGRNPAEFRVAKEQIQLMIDAIRQFIVRTTPS